MDITLKLTNVEFAWKTNRRGVIIFAMEMVCGNFKL